MRRVALVTGGARGIGRSIALDLAADHEVAITRNTSPATGLPENVHVIQADLAQPGAGPAVIDQVVARFGQLDAIVNNAGVIAMSPVDQFDGAALASIFDVNLFAPQALLAAARTHLKPGAAIVNISSMNAVLPPRDASMYGASKAALNLWTRAMAKELGPHQIRVNAVAPGAINTPEAPRSPELTKKFVELTALGRIGTPEDIAAAVRFLLSDAAAFITGEILAVSGGYRL